ncbi:XRE family transcriptional regulator [Brevibacillus invocatus]|uniref:XRE family transcriptional regulator n=1 Tax=Brevibacillus invocatus TaxID=173959 RepID=A0A3M8C2T4_9BACL|nr:helix-turn-helix transcriptional regulator [Brevibacillus invocatus]RNB69951.1 XRE family transcriptional regulator [Brevibacillus invocatus]
MKIKVKDLDHLNELLLRKGFTKTSFSKAIKLSQPMTIQITNGDRHPSPPVAKRITDTLAVEFDDIFVIVKATGVTAG